MRIALVQMTAIRNDKKANLDKMETFIKKASEENASIVCFPELSVTGYVKNQPDFVAESLEGPSVERLKTLAANFNITILAGMAEKEHKQAYISQMVIQPDGLVDVYRKTHLGAREKKTFTQGESVPVFNRNSEQKKSKFGIGLCYDLHYPDLVSSLALQGARIVFAPHALPIGGQRRLSIWDKYMPARAYDNGVFVLACNLVGHDGKKHFGGGMGVWNPKGENILRCCEEKELMMMLDLDMDIFSKKKSESNKIGYLDDRRVKLYLGSEGFAIDGSKIG